MSKPTDDQILGWLKVYCGIDTWQEIDGPAEFESIVLRSFRAGWNAAEERNMPWDED